MSTEIQVAAASFAVITCLAIGYGMYLASAAIARVSDLAALSGMLGAL